MYTAAIMGNGPIDQIPDLKQYKEEIDIWIGADRGALTLAENGIVVDFAVGDFDSMDDCERKMLHDKALHVDTYSADKDETDLEIALYKAFEMKVEKIYIFGVTGGRLDHALINIQLLHSIVQKDLRGVIVDKWNQVELTKPGKYTVNKEEAYPYISFIPFTKRVGNLSLTGFLYPLTAYDHYWGSTRCISNQLVDENGIFSYEEGLLLFIKSRDIDARL